MEKTDWRNIMAIYGDWRIFRRILKHDLALDGASGRRCMALSGRRRGQIRYGEIVVVAAFNLVGEAMLHGGPGLFDVVV